MINKLIQVTVEKLDVACASEDYYVLAIHALMKIKLKVMIDQVRKKWTRSDSNNYDHMRMVLHKRIKKGKITNAHSSTSKRNMVEVKTN